MAHKKNDIKMAFALLIIGAVLLIAAVRGTTDGPEGLYALLVGDFTGPANFVYWAVAILLIGALGYIPKLKAFSVALLALVVLVLFLKKGDPSGVGGGFFAQLTSGLATTQKPVAASSKLPAPVPGANAPGFNQPGSIINNPAGSTGGGSLSFPFLPPITPLVQ